MSETVPGQQPLESQSPQAEPQAQPQVQPPQASPPPSFPPVPLASTATSAPPGAPPASPSTTPHASLPAQPLRAAPVVAPVIPVTTLRAPEPRESPPRREPPPPREPPHESLHQPPHERAHEPPHESRAKASHESRAKPDPELEPVERAKVREAQSLDAKTTYEVIREQGEKELARPGAALAYSGLAAGLSMGLSMVAEGVMRSHLPDAPWRPLITKFGYSVGFLAVILGSQQLFTENTLTPVVPLLSKKSDTKLADVLRLWGIVLATNIVGTLLFALVAAYTPLFRPEMKDAFAALGSEAVAGTIVATFLRAIAAGFIIALMVWMLPDAKYARVAVIVIMTYLIGVAQLSHIIAGSAEVFYAAAAGVIPWGSYVVDFFLPTLTGNVIGGVALVAALNHGQVTAGEA